MEIRTQDLKDVIDILFSHLEKSGYVSFDLEQDYYWNINKEQRYDPYHPPTEIDMGQLEDDWHELLKILHGHSEPIGYALVWLAAILRNIGEQVKG